MNSKLKYWSILLSTLFLISCGESEVPPISTQSSAKKIESFVILGNLGMINEANKTISIELPFGTDLTSLAPEINLSQLAGVNPSSGSSQDFTNTVNYVVTAEDMSTVVYAATASAIECVNPSNIVSFMYNEKKYEIVKEAKTWELAAACATERGGYLAEINNSAENSELINQLINASGISLDNTVAQDGGGASYVWIGGNDISTEGNWIWDGESKGSGEQFWQGDASGSVINGLYNNWGTEPDDFNENQDGLGIAITQWPLASGSLGTSGQWNDVAITNTIYFIIEYD